MNFDPMGVANKGMAFFKSLGGKAMDMEEWKRTMSGASTIDHAEEVIEFFYVWSIVSMTGGGYIERFLMSCIRAWGAVAFVVPLVLAV